MPLTSAQLFRKLYPEEAKNLERVTNEGWFQRATMHVKAEITELRWSPEKIEGANEFLKLLNALSAEENPVNALPEKALKGDRIGDVKVEEKK